MRKVFKNGNSLAVTIPKAYAHQLSIRDGSRVEWKEANQAITLKKVKEVKPKGVSQKFARMVNEFISDHEDVLRDLAKR